MSNSSIAFLLILAMNGLSAQSKDAEFESMIALAQEYEIAKMAADESSMAALLENYSSISARLGGDDPMGLLNVGPDREAVSPRLAPVAPPSTTASSTNTVGGGAGTAINDNNTFSVDAVVSGDAYLWDLDLNLDITHTFPGDLDITLTSPSGTEIVVTTDNGSGSDDSFAGTLFDDQAGFGNEVTDVSYTTGVAQITLIPEGAFGAFIGEDPNGTWTLSVGDDAGGDSGTLNSWSLDITTLDQGPTTSPILVSSNIPALAISDNTTITDTVDFAGVEPFLCEVSLFTDITHTFPGDLDITLESPAGTVTAITTDNAGTADDVFAGTTWADTNSDTVTDADYTTGVVVPQLQPEGAMAAFLGEDPNGTWTLSIGDDADGDTGTLNEWSVSLVGCVEGQPPLPESTPVPTLSAWGIAAMLLIVLTLGGMVLRRQV